MILTVQKMQQIKPCSKNNTTRLEQIIRETEFSDFQRLVGTDVYNRLVADTADPQNIPTELQSILDDGLYAVIAYLSYAQYIQEISVVDTFSGMVQKHREDSTTVPQGMIKNLAIKNRQIAEQHYDKVRSRLQEYCGLITGETIHDGFSEIYSVRRVGGKHRRNIIQM